MKLCVECNSEVAENDLFCPYCGIAMPGGASVAPDSSDGFDSTIVIPAAEMPPMPNLLVASDLVDENSSRSASGELVHDLVVAEGPVIEESVNSIEFLPDPLEPDDVELLSSESGVSTDPIDAVVDDVSEEVLVQEDPVEEIVEPDGADEGLSFSEADDSQAFEENESSSSADFSHDPIPELNEVAEETPETLIPEAIVPVAAAVDATNSGEMASSSGTSQIASNQNTDGKRSGLKPLAEGTILNGRYDIVRKIGGGGMGAVYLASDRNLGGVPRAVKEMVQSHIEESQQEKAVEDFKRESMILSSLEHPAIPTIYDYFYDESECRFYLVMKYISGGDLAGKLRAAPEGRIDERTTVEWAIQIIDVLDYLHNLPDRIVYRDLKPSNVMIDGNTGRVVLVDFGIARSINQTQEKGVTAVGTMGYAPPELFSGSVEPRSDIYSLGSTLFHLMTGADPQNNPLLIFDFEKNPRPRQINPQLTDQIERILMRSVEYNADARYSSAAEMKNVLIEHRSNLDRGQVTYGVSVAPEVVSLSEQLVFCGFCGQRIVATDMFCAFCGSKQPLGQQGVHREIYSTSTATAKLLVVGTNDLEAPAYMIEKAENLLGRRDPMSNIFPEVDLSKYDPQTKISRRHAKIWHDGNRFLVEDLGSSNGTLLVPTASDSTRLTPHLPHPLTNGDRLRIGDTVLHFIVN